MAPGLCWGSKKERECERKSKATKNIKINYFLIIYTFSRKSNERRRISMGGSTRFTSTENARARKHGAKLNSDVSDAAINKK